MPPSGQPNPIVRPITDLSRRPAGIPATLDAAPDYPHAAGMSDLDGDARTGADHPIRRNRADILQAGLNRAGLAGLGVVFCASVLLQPGDIRAPLGASLVFLLLCWCLGRLMRRHYTAPRFGAANTVTLIRAALVCALLAPFASGGHGGWPVAIIAGIALSLDGVDGWLARRNGMATDFGARFDVEIDALLALILSLHAFQGAPGPWTAAAVLGLGLVRYLFVLASVMWPWLAAPLPPRWRRKAICVLQLATLILLQVPGIPAGEALVLTGAALAPVLWSFGVDIIWLWARRR